MNWHNYFEMIADWKRLPAYKAEPRIDSLVGYFLPDMASEFLADPIKGIIPEFPIRLATIYPSLEGKTEQSCKVDFYLLGSSGTHYFVEFKTDSGSRREKQDKYLAAAQEVGMAALIKGILTIESVTLPQYKQKYEHLIGKLRKLKVLGEREMSSDTIEVVYVQPRRQDGDTKRVIDFNWIAKWLTDKCGQSDYELALANAMSRWAND